MAVSNPNPVADLGPSEPGSGRHGPSADGPSDHARQADLRVADPGSEPGSSSADVGDCPVQVAVAGATQRTRPACATSSRQAGVDESVRAGTGTGATQPARYSTCSHHAGVRMADPDPESGGPKPGPGTGQVHVADRADADADNDADADAHADAHTHADADEAG